ncbi:Sir2- type regulatory transcription factor silent information regulator protein [Thalassiosira pseudonana CCMP1335]|uniref:Sir2-type regulatory transcription factor silent information regulator protein n=1 Tax=Thalassiosira pseudonana TaxID=35128 RepID=B5YNJ6_THAPS|nr:Sir2- type regulatory transcription factor silent information regulator protein [Thalassiosira pseudonana CCMP1335]ACI64641.1 Sir2- type regulatory transcription factor silent information regulator protein [Thalassiosira pseudonana CCMP1335]
MRGKKAIVCITGAGLSTESGIPDYRGSNGSYFRGHKPIIHHEFMTSETTRKRYWARSLMGYSPFANAQPNLGHISLATMEEKGKISTITQNVDTLHSKAGLKHVLHLHGRGDLVKCMACGLTRDRKEYHNQLFEKNREWVKSSTPGTKNDTDDKLRPDGDAEVNGNFDEIILPSCPEYNQQSFFKTDVVFFGDSIPRDRVSLSNAAIDASDGVLCIGTSLAVHSAFRLAKRAIASGTPVAILNVGQTRIEKEGLESLKVESPIGETLAELLNLLENEDR